MSTEKRNTQEDEKFSVLEAWSDHLLVAVFFVFLVLLSVICR